MDVLILVGSESDLDVAGEVTKVLDRFGVEYELHIASAHRSPDKVKNLVTRADTEGAKVIIAGAGMSAHLAGVVASITLLPVIGIPISAGPLNGVDALYSTVNMPGGVPVATVSIGKAGGKNAALLALRIIAVGDESLRSKLSSYTKEMAQAVEDADARLQNKK
ncbi:N5-carboxyaminoimidazole ribonucleotide mutase [hydrothermal vent metagenome]|uniref:N5-carboxyaminoimidazole ribonucleotide mutase n=1 Tax=hydrothermal vent metagenome TaxID=652676 RepID=A0A3B1BXU3_9ZZZZ